METPTPEKPEGKGDATDRRRGGKKGTALSKVSPWSGSSETSIM